MRNKRSLVWALAAALMLLPVSASAAAPPVPRTDILIDIGHGGVDGGTSFGSILEKDINLSVGLKLYPILRKQGVTVSINRTRDYALSDDNKWLKGSRHKRDLAQRVEIANKLKPVYMLSLHVNWSDNRSKTGPLIIYQKNNEASRKLALHLQEELNQLYGTSTKPEPGRKYYLLKHAKVPSVIVEMGYLSNGRDRGVLSTPDFQHKLGEAIAKASTAALQERTQAMPSSRRNKASK